jgi:hypothetical protein
LAEPITELLQRVRAGDEAASHELMPLVYGELQRIARIHLSKERPANRAHISSSGVFRQLDRDCFASEWRVMPTPEATARAGSRPGVVLSSASGSAIKRINGWREGPPLTVLC